MIKCLTDVTCESPSEFYHCECTINPSSEHHYAKHQAENDKSRDACIRFDARFIISNCSNIKATVLRKVFRDNEKRRVTINNDN